MLKIPCEQLVEGENKDPILRLFSISYTFRARCPLSRCGLAAIFEVADVNENSLSTFACDYLHRVISAKLGP